MSTIQTLRAFVNQRLTAAVEEIFGLLEKTISNYEEEIGRQRRLLEDVDIRRHAADVPWLLAIKQEAPFEQQEDRRSVGQENPESSHIKQEQEDVWSSQEGEHNTKFPFTAVSVKTEDEERAQSSEPRQSQTEDSREVEAPACSSTQLMETDLTDSETEDSDGEWKARKQKTRTPQPASSFIKHKEINNRVEKCTCGISKKTHECSECGKKFKLKGSLRRHIKVHTGEKPFSCSVCGKKFGRKQVLQAHMTIHTGEKPFSCTVCGRSFRYRETMKNHMKVHMDQTQH